MNELLPTTIIIGILASAIRLATPYLYAAIGEAFAQTSGVVNLGVDGIMLIGAFTGFYVTLTYGNLWLGLLAAVIAGLLMGLLMSFISVTLKAEQGISGIGLYMFGLGLSSPAVQGHGRHGQDRHRLPAAQDPLLGRYPGARPDLLQPQPAGVRRLPAGAAGLVGAG